MKSLPKSNNRNVEFVTFGVVIDDIVHPDGRTSIGMLGGGGPQTAFGMRLWSPSVGLVASVGVEEYKQVLDWLHQSDIRTEGLQKVNYPTPRAWQLFDPNGRRSHQWQTSDESIKIHLDRSVDHIPLSFQSAKGYHLGIHPDAPDIEFLAELRELNLPISIETFRGVNDPLSQKQLRIILEGTTIFSANQLEFNSLQNFHDPHEQNKLLFDFGVKIVVVRLGEAGALLFDETHRDGIHIPAVPVNVVDPTGAGNAFCGAFLVGWVLSGDLITAGVSGSVAASFVLEQPGIPVVTEKLVIEGHKRAERLIQYIEERA